jgi:UDP-N-acetylmuramyl pentapeptide synthase
MREDLAHSLEHRPVDRPARSVPDSGYAAHVSATGVIAGGIGADASGRTSWPRPCPGAADYLCRRDELRAGQKRPSVRPPIGGERRLRALVPVLRLRAGVAAATVYRAWLKRVTFIGVTGSAGKTTTKELIFAALSSELRGRKTPAAGNGLAVVAKTILRTTNRDAFCVLEVAAGDPGQVARTARMARPQIAVVTRIGSDHYKLYRTPESTVAEKRHLLAAAPDGSTAVLNADDPHVMAMAEGFPGRVLTFGCSPGAILRAHDVRSAWPERLSFTLELDGRSLAVRTRLCGRHWLPSVLAALGAAVAIGIPIEPAIDALGEVAPTPGRMSPVSLGGVTFICDHTKAPLWTIDSVLEFLEEAQAPRKIAVFGTISDYAGSSSQIYRATARRACAVSDQVVFVGPNARHALKRKQEVERGALHAFATLSEAALHLRATLRAGDLVLLKGSDKADRLDRILPAAIRQRDRRAASLADDV